MIQDRVDHCTYCAQYTQVREVPIERRLGTSYVRVCHNCKDMPHQDPLGLHCHPARHQNRNTQLATTNDSH